MARFDHWSREMVEGHSDISVVMSVYSGDNPAYFRKAVSSMLNQTYTPREIIIVVDGAVPDTLQVVLEEFSSNPLIKIFVQKDNLGLGISRNYAISKAAGSMIAVMDSDDISDVRRLALQHEEMKRANVDVIGGAIGEFSECPERVKRFRRVPGGHFDILRRGRSISPFNHVTLMFKKEIFMSVGGYGSYRCIEDYDLFYRLALAGAVFANLSAVLVFVRVDIDQYARRLGIKYFKEECSLVWGMYKSGFIGGARMCFNIALRSLWRLTPAYLSMIITRTVLRDSKL